MIFFLKVIICKSRVNGCFLMTAQDLKTLPCGKFTNSSSKSFLYLTDGSKHPSRIESRSQMLLFKYLCSFLFPSLFIIEKKKEQIQQLLLVFLEQTFVEA